MTFTGFKVITKLTGLSLGLGLLTWLIHPESPKWDPDPFAAYEKTLDEILAVDRPVIWFDARAPDAYEEKHIPGAFRLTEEEWDVFFEPLLFEYWQPDTLVIVYCDNQGCQKSKRIARRIREEAPQIEAYYLKGGWQTWIEQKH